jgi:2-polyprenyl-6-hydroxyphenyl methylase/3-demethylubiquinone-9 3-methyltransferase
MNMGKRKNVNVDEKEIRKFDEIAPIWWDPKGEMRTLHVINPLRMRFIQEKLDLHGCKVLDVGCGGGILSETLVESGAQVLGIDLSRMSLEVARQHAKQRGLNIAYQNKALEEIAPKQVESFDAVTCMEMLEHDSRPFRIVADCAKVLKPGGHFFCSTLNRTLKALLFAIIGGEYVLHLLPRGSHMYSRLIRPDELKKWTRENGLDFESLVSLMYNPFRRRFTVVPDREDVSYMAHFIKR